MDTSYRRGASFETEDGTDFIEAPEADILIVDDNLVNIKVTMGLLKFCKIKPDMVQSGREAIEKIKGKHYDIVLMDHLMPDMDGLETTAIIRGEGYDENNLTIIALSANDAEDARQMFLNCGMQDFLAKPLDRGSLNGMLKKWLPREKVIDPKKIKAEKLNFLEKFRKIEHLDLDAGIRKANGDLDAYEHSVVVLTKNAPSIASLLSDCTDLKRITSLTHGAQVLLENAGATRMSDHAEAINQAASRGDMDFCREELPGFIEDLTLLCRHVSEMF